MTYTESDLRAFFQSKFDLDVWVQWMHDFFEVNDIRTNPELITSANSNEEGYFLGRFVSDVYHIGFFYYKVNQGSVVTKKVGLRNLVKSFINTSYGEFEAALVVFDSGDHWRLSFVCDIKEEKTSPKRFTFVFGDKDNLYRTPVKRFAELQKKGISFDSIREAFSVEALTKEFYNELFDWYQRAVDEKSRITFPNDTSTDKDDRENIDVKIIRMITRLIFVWFIKQKELVPNNLFDPEFLKSVLRDFDAQSSNSSVYYNAILQNLFFATLNKAIKDENGEGRRFAHLQNKRDIKSLYRYEEMFSIPEEDVIKLFADVPFLNGGLFECLDKAESLDGKRYNYDGFSRNATTFTNGTYKHRAFVPNVLFFDKENGLFSIFSRYNFTIEENSPNEQQVALDPELLGKVFENLLGAYNPETKETARNQSGSFYTPREIVNYMVDESLKAYLGDIDFIENLFSDEFVRDETRAKDYEEVAFKLLNIKVLDPACGSGAFPMGLLTRMVDLLQKLTPEHSVREMKLEIIEKCLYGGDIQSIATQISKLRFFISLICDCEKDASLPNFGIPPLPNLETKFVSANSLISLKTENSGSLNLEDEKLLELRKKLREVRHEHFHAKSANRKSSLRKLDEDYRNQIIHRLKEIASTPDDQIIERNEKRIAQLRTERETYSKPLWVEQDAGAQQMDLLGFEPQKTQGTLFRVDANKKHRDRIDSEIAKCERAIASEQRKATPHSDFEKKLHELASWNPYDQNAVSSFLEPEWMFGVKEFDVVIGNPPYISTKGIKAEDKKLYENEFGFSDDTYNLFTFKGLQLCKKGGALTYITPKTFWTIQTKHNMRELILSYTIDYIFDTANPFEAVMVDTCIFQIIKQTPNEAHKVRFFDGTNNLTTPIAYNPIKQKVYLDSKNSVIFKPNYFNLKIHELYGQKVKDLYDTWWDKIKTSRDIEKNKVELCKYRESLKPGDITLLGCITEGGQGLATANNGKYVAVRKTTKWSKNILLSRPKKLDEAIKKYKICIPELSNFSDTKEYLASLSEKEIADLFDRLKEQYGRDIFGQGYIYKLIDDTDIANVDSLTEDEKVNGIDVSKKIYVPYDKGDKDGNRWYLETPFAIAWSKENVQFLKTDSKARYQGYTFFFREGLCWSDINTKKLKCRKKQKSIHDVKSMSLFSSSSLISENYIITLINSTLISEYVDNFINNTQTFQINDARQIPVIIINEDYTQKINVITQNAIQIKKNENNKSQLIEIDNEIDSIISEIYCL